MPDDVVLQQANQMAKQGLISPEQFGRIASKLAAGIGDAANKLVTTPGRVIAPNPYPEGSEEASWYDDNRAKAIQDWAPQAALTTMGSGTAIGAPVNAGEKLIGASVRPYTNVQDSLMGFRKSGPQKAFDETNFPHIQNVEVTLPKNSISSRDTFRDQIRGMNPDHAVERAYRNWPDAVHIRAVE